MGSSFEKKYVLIWGRRLLFRTLHPHVRFTIASHICELLSIFVVEVLTDVVLPAQHLSLLRQTKQITTMFYNFLV